MLNWYICSYVPLRLIVTKRQKLLDLINKWYIIIIEDEINEKHSHNRFGFYISFL
jgi:hypothetical protein